MPFMFENLEVYKRAMEFVKKAYVICNSKKAPFNRKLIDQLQRASLSIPLNIAEGNGRIHTREKKQYFYTARGSLLECVPILQLCQEIDITDRTKYEELYLLADEIGKMLNGLIKSVDRRAELRK